MSLRLRLVALLLLLTGGVVAALLTLGLLWQKDVAAAAEQQARAALEHRSKSVSAEVARARQHLRLLASSPTLDLNQLDAAREWLDRLNRQDSLFEGFYLYTLAGEMYAARGHPVTVYNDEFLAALRAGQPQTGQASFNRYTGQSTLRLTTPLHDAQGQLTGALGGTMVLRQLVDQALAQQQNDSAELLMFDADGRLVSSTLEREQRLLEVPTPRGAPLSAAVWATWQTQGTDPSAPWTVAHDGQLWRGLALRMHTPDWVMVYLQPLEKLSPRLQRTLEVMGLMVVLALALGAVVLWQLNRVALQPLARLQQAHRDLGRGDFSVRLDADEGAPELQELAQAFNHTAQALAQAHEQEQEALRRLRTLVGNLPGMAYRATVDVSWKMFFVSEGCREIFGVEPADFTSGRINYPDLVHPDDLAILWQKAEEAFQTCAPVTAEYRIVRPDGAVRWVWERWQCLPDEQGTPLATEGFIMDLTERKAAEDSQRLLQEQLMATLEQTPTVATQWYDEAGTVLYWNAASTALYGFEPHEVMGRTANGTLFDAQTFPEFLTVLHGIAQTGQPFGPFEAEVCTRDGRRVMVLATTFRIPLASGGVAFVCMDVDISKLKAAEASLRELNASLEAKIEQRTQELVTTLEQLRRTQSDLVQSEKMASLGSLVAGVAHELNTPIGNAVMMASTLAERTREFQRALENGLKRSTLQDFVSVVDDSSAVLQRNLMRAAELVSSFKQVAVDQSSYQRRCFELGEIVQEITLAMSPLLKRAGCEWEVAPLPSVRLDSYPGPLGQVFMNLISNALVHAYGNQPGGRILLQATLDGERLRLTLEDFGAGIPPEQLPKVFDPFFTTRMGQGGSGLGLSIVYNLVTGLLGGAIEVRSQRGQGTCFTITLPVVAPQGAEHAAGREQAQEQA